MLTLTVTGHDRSGILVFTEELMDVSGLWNLNERKEEKLLYLLVFVWSPRSEGWPR